MIKRNIGRLLLSIVKELSLVPVGRRNPALSAPQRPVEAREEYALSLKKTNEGQQLDFVIIWRAVAICEVLGTISHGERVAALGIGDKPRGRVCYL
jgi:hypothetical protein